MEPAAHAPLTRAAARKRSAPEVDASGDRARVVRAMAQGGGALLGACLVMGIASRAGVPAVDTPPAPVAETEHIADHAPRPVTDAPLPTPHVSPTATPSPTESDAVSPVVIDPASSAPPEPAPTATTPPADDGEAATEPEKGKRDSAPGRNKPPKP